MSLKSRARAIQKLTGYKYTAARQEIINRGPLIGALKRLHPEMTMQEVDAAICFEDEETLRQRWGLDVLRLARELSDNGGGP